MPGEQQQQQQQQQTQQQDPGNLVAAAQQQSAATAAAAQTAAAQAGTVTQQANGKLNLTYDEAAIEQVFGKPDKDGRPERVPAKYWDASKKAIKADVVFNQLLWSEGKLGQSKLDLLGAPPEKDGYKITMPEGADFEFDPEDPAIKGFLAVARKHDISQKFVDEVLGEVVKLVGDARGTNWEAEMKKLGTDGQARLKNFGDFLSANLTKDEAATLMNMVTSAEQFSALEAMTRKMGAPAFVPREPGGGPAGPASGKMTREEWEKLNFATDEHGNRLRSIDPEYNARVERLAQEIFGTTRRDASGRPVDERGNPL